MEELHYLCRENKGADQLRRYCTADLRLFFSHMQKTGFLTMQLICCKVVVKHSHDKIFDIYIDLSVDHL